MKFDMSDAWRRAAAMIAANREVLLVVGGLFFFLPNVVWGFALGDAGQMAARSAAEAEAAVLESYERWWWLLLLVALASALGSLTLLTLLRGHTRPTVSEAIRMALRALPSLVATYVAIAVVAVLPLSILLAIGNGSAGLDAVVKIVGFILLAFAFARLSLVAPAIAINRLMNPLRAIARSWRLTKGHTLRLLGFFLLLAVVYVVLALVAGIVTGGASLLGGPRVAVIVSTVVSGLLSAAASVVLVAVIAAIHRQLAAPHEPDRDEVVR